MGDAVGFPKLNRAGRLDGEHGKDQSALTLLDVGADVEISISATPPARVAVHRVREVIGMQRQGLRR